MPRRPTLAVFSLLAALCALPAGAQTQKLEPLPAVPPPPPEMLPFDAALEPQVTIKKRDGETVEEFRSGGKLYMVKVTPDHGTPYYLVDERGDGAFIRRESLDKGLKPPMWIIKQF
jgi:hypothetical protein